MRFHGDRRKDVLLVKVSQDHSAHACQGTSLQKYLNTGHACACIDTHLRVGGQGLVAS